MATISQPIALDKSETASRLNYELTVKGKNGEALAGAAVVVRVEGDGSLAPGFDAKEQRREADDSGLVEFTWYRRSIFGRNVKATLSATVDGEGCELSLQAVEGEPSVRMSWIPRRIKY